MKRLPKTVRKPTVMRRLLLITLPVMIISYTTLVCAGGLMDKAQSAHASTFTLMSTTGKDISLSDYKGKFVLLNFWATWCPPCVKEMPALNDLHKQLRSNNSFEVVGVHVGPALATVKQFLKDKPVDFDVVIDKNMSLSNWPVSGLPTTFLISPTGDIIYQATGEREWNSQEMVKFIKNAMKEF